MALKNPRSVYVEKPEASFGQIMNEMRSWFDNRKIQPVAFKCLAMKPGVVVLDIRFERDEDAQLFESDFA